MGLINLNARIACSVNAALEAPSLPAGRLALVSQSGSMMGAIMSRGAPRGIGFSHIIGTGNEADLTAGEVAGLLVDDPQRRRHPAVPRGHPRAGALRRPRPPGACRGQAGHRLQARPQPLWRGARHQPYRRAGRLGCRRRGLLPRPWHRPRHDPRRPAGTAGAAGRPHARWRAPIAPSASPPPPAAAAPWRSIASACSASRPAPPTRPPPPCWMPPASSTTAGCWT